MRVQVVSMEQSIAVELQGKTLKVTVSGVQVFSKADDDAKGLGADITKRADRGQINASLTAISVSLPYLVCPVRTLAHVASARPVVYRLRRSSTRCSRGKLPPSAPRRC